MALTPWEKIAEDEVVHANPYWEYRRALFLAPNGKPREYHYVKTKGAVAIIGLTDDGRVPLINQYRPLMDRESLELPMGGTDGEEPLIAAKREFAEEAKFAAEQWEWMGRHLACNGVLTEAMDIFIATGLTPVETGQDEVEEFEHLFLTPEEIDHAIADHRITDGMTISAWCQVRPRVMDLRMELG